MRIIWACALLIGSMLFVGCSNTTLLPEGHNTYTIISPSSDEADAYREAMKKATEVCTKDGKQVCVLSQNSNYQGIDKNAKAAIGLASIVASAIVKSNMGSNNSNNNDYKVTIKFRCE